jgi:hypothetical protein
MEVVATINKNQLEEMIKLIKERRLLKVIMIFRSKIEKINKKQKIENDKKI